MGKSVGFSSVAAPPHPRLPPLLHQPCSQQVVATQVLLELPPWWGM